MSNTGNTGSAVATITSGANTSNPTIVFKSVGSFSIRADASYSSNYTIAHTISEPIEVTKDKPIVKFLSIYVFFNFAPVFSLIFRYSDHHRV